MSKLDYIRVLSSLGELLEKFHVWKTNLEKKGLCVNVGKTKIMISAHNASKPVEANKCSCDVCNKGVGSNSIKCLVCGFWVHKRCSNVKGPLKPNPDLKCNKCRGEVSNAAASHIDPVDIHDEEIEKVSFFSYLGDFIEQRGGCLH